MTTTETEVLQIYHILVLWFYNNIAEDKEEMEYDSLA